MATLPTALASVPPAPAAAPVPAKVSSMRLVVRVLIGVVVAALGFAGGVSYLARSGRLPMQKNVASKAASISPISTHAMVLDPLLVNLSDTTGGGYLRISLTLQVQDAVLKQGSKAKDDKATGDKAGNEAVAAVRDTALSVLGRQTSNDLLASDGKERLKANLKMAFREHNPDLKVNEVFFTDFLVQR